MPNELRVALFSGNYNYQKDGANKALNRLVRYLGDQGIPVLVFSPTGRKPAFRHDGTLVSVPSVPVPGRGDYRLGLPLSANLKATLDAFAPTLIHLSAPDWLGFSALTYAEQRDIPAVASFHTRFDTYLRHYGFGWLEPACRARMSAFYARCAEVFVPSESMAQVLAADGIVRGPVLRWGRGIERDAFSPERRDMGWRRHMGLADTDLAVTFVGRLVREKGLGTFAGMMETLAARGVSAKALIIGDGHDRAQIATRLPEAVMTGHLDGEALWRAFGSGDIFVNPSETETFGNVTLEAMSSGLVPVCVNATGSANLVDHGRTGHLVPAAEADLFARAVARLAARPGERRAMAAAAREASAAHDWNEVLGGVLAGYRSVLGAGHPLAEPAPLLAAA